MTEYEWEVGRIPRGPDAGLFGARRPRKEPIAEYVALEFPRESVTWVVTIEPRGQAQRPASGPSETGEPPKRRSGQG